MSVTLEKRQIVPQCYADRAHNSKQKQDYIPKGKKKSNLIKHKTGHSQNKSKYNLSKKLKKINFSKLIKKALPYIIFGYFGNKMTYSFRLTTDKNFFMRLVKSLGNLGKAFENIFPSFNGYDLLGGVITGALIWFIVYTGPSAAFSRPPPSSACISSARPRVCGACGTSRISR